MKLGSSNSNDFKQFLNSYMTLPAATNPNTIHMRKFADGADEVTRSLRDKTAGHQSSGLIERKIRRSPNTGQQYKDFLDESFQRFHMEQLTSAQIQENAE